MKLIENTYQFYSFFSWQDIIEEEKIITDKLLEDINVKENTKENVKLITNKILEQPLYLQFHILNNILNEYYQIYDHENETNTTSDLFEKVLANEKFKEFRELTLQFVDDDIPTEERLQKIMNLKQKLGINIFIKLDNDISLEYYHWIPNELKILK